MAQLAVFAAWTVHKGDESPVLTLAIEVAEKFGRFLSAPVFNAPVLWYVDALEVYRLAECLRELAEHHNEVSTKFRGCFPKRPFQETLAIFEIQLLLFALITGVLFGVGVGSGFGVGSGSGVAALTVEVP